MTTVTPKNKIKKKKVKKPLLKQNIYENAN